MKSQNIIASVFAFIIGIFIFNSLAPAQGIKFDESLFGDSVKYVNCFDNSISGCYSNISGYGLSYTRRFLNSYAITFTGLSIYNESKKWEDMTKAKLTENTTNILYNFGIEIQRDIFTTNATKVFGMIGGYYSKVNDEDLKNGNDETIYAVGAGFGFQLYLSKYVSAYASIGYKLDHSDKITTTNGKDSPALRNQTMVGFGTGLSFSF
ncbi:MAG: hypothetical protein NT007_01430 [Candidatus Kapabacteria bacterium]|nr:hypothetical protein [Candidatus Kapabacteria bacterium]